MITVRYCLRIREVWVGGEIGTHSRLRIWRASLRVRVPPYPQGDDMTNKTAKPKKSSKADAIRNSIMLGLESVQPSSRQSNVSVYCTDNKGNYLVSVAFSNTMAHWRVRAVFSKDGTPLELWPSFSCSMLDEHPSATFIVAQQVTRISDKIEIVVRKAIKDNLALKAVRSRK